MKLDGTFALHPALPKLREHYGAGEATFLHAVASPYRDRSHFDGQNVLETGGRAPYHGLVGALREGMGAAWAETVVVVATEFGRTVAANGTGGTDHGTAAAAMVIGGAVHGGRILADWPGLTQASLFGGRDLKPTLGLDTLIASTCADTFRLDPERTVRVLFPDAVRGQRMQRLLRA